MSDEAKYDLTAKTFYGLEEVLAKELKELGAENIKIANRAVNFRADLRLMYLANFHLRTAISILKPVHTFKVKNEDDLYKKIQDFDWSQVFSLKQTFAVEPTVYSPVFKHSQYVALKTKDAIVDQFREKTGKRPFVDTENPDIIINLHISDLHCTVSLNSSGEPLFKRGYRISAQEAPLNEVLAAGLIALSGWQPHQHFIDPMCGSGTLAIEAALIANKVPSGIFRKKFGFESWTDFNKDLFTEITSDDEGESATVAKARILASDVASKSISIARSNIKNAFLHNSIETNVSDFLSSVPDVDSGVIIMNPPYGERLKQENISNFYKEIGNTLKQNYKNFDAWIITSNFDALKSLGLHPTKKIKLMNASLECTFNRYSIYEGSNKKKYYIEKNYNFNNEE